MSFHKSFYGLGPAYQPAMMEFSGTEWWSATSGLGSGNKITIVMRFALEPFTGDTFYRLARLETSTNATSVGVILFSSDWSSATTRQDCIEFYVRNSSGGTAAVLLYTEEGSTRWLDGEPHTMVLQYDGDAGTASMYIDGIDASDTSHTDYSAPVTATMESSRHEFAFGANVDGTFSTTGQLGFLGYDDSAGHDYADFMDSSGNPIKQDETTWSNSGFGSQPLFWNEHGDMLNNNGSAGNMTRNGTIVVAPAS